MEGVAVTEKVSRVSRLIDGFKELGKWGARGFQGELAEKLHCTEGYISMIFAGKKSPSHNMVRLACLDYGINLDYVLTGEGPVLVQTAKEEGGAAKTGKETETKDGPNLDLMIYQKFGGVKADIWGIVETLLPDEAIRALQLLRSQDFGCNRDKGQGGEKVSEP